MDLSFREFKFNFSKPNQTIKLIVSISLQNPQSQPAKNACQFQTLFEVELIMNEYIQTPTLRYLE